MMQPQTSAQCCPPGSLKVAIIVMGTFGHLFWGNSIGFTLGYSVYQADTLLGSHVLIPLNIAYMYVTCRIFFLITSKLYLTSSDVLDLQQNTARLVALTIVGFSEWVTSTVWYAQSPSAFYDTYLVFFVCSFSFVFAAVVAGLAGGLNDWYNKQLPMFVQGPQIITPVAQHYSAQQVPLQYQGPAPSAAPQVNPAYYSNER